MRFCSIVSIAVGLLIECYPRTILANTFILAGSRMPKWGKTAPWWWPKNVPFTGPNNNRGGRRLRVDDLDEIVTNFMESWPAAELPRSDKR